MFKKTVLMVFCSVLFFAGNAHFMSRIWPQKGMAANEVGSPDAAKKVLIAGRGSAFRDTVVSRLVARLHDDSVYVRIIDLKDVATQDPQAWNAVLLVNMCVAWDYDSKVKQYIRGHADCNNVVLFTTSGDPAGCFPKNKKGRNPEIDGYSSASSMDECVHAVDTLYDLLNAVLIGRKGQ